jgi:hypothetical protein
VLHNFRLVNVGIEGFGDATADNRRTSHSPPMNNDMTCGHRTIGGSGITAFAIVVICAMLAVPGCGGEQPTREQAIQSSSQRLRQAVSTNVADEGRKAQMLVVVDQIEAAQTRFSKEMADFVESYRKLNADYGATRPAFDKLFSDYNVQRIKVRNEALDLHFQLASLSTATEWNPIVEAEVKLYEEVNAVRPAEGSAK